MRVSFGDRPGPYVSWQDITDHADEDGSESVTVPDGTLPERGVTAARLAERAGLAPTIVRQMTIVGPNGGPSITLDTDQVVNGFTGDPAGSPRRAVFDPGYGNQIRFVRPADSDTQRFAWIQAPNQTDLAVTIVTDGQALGPGILEAANTSLDPRASVHFTISPPAGAPALLTYHWDFGDGTGGDAAAADDHAFEAGTYDVQVTFVAPDGSSGVSNTVRMQVGPVDGGGITTTPVPPAGPATSGTGGNGSGGGAATAGGGNGKKDNRPTGTRKGKGTGTTVPTDAGAKGEATSARTYARGKQTTTAPPAPATTSSGAAGGTASAAGGRASTPAATTPAPKAAPAPRQQGTPAPARGGAPVRGVVVSGTGGDLAGALAAADALANTPDPAPARAAAGHGARPWGWVGGGVGLLALLALGAVREGARPRRLRGSGRLRPV